MQVPAAARPGDFGPRIFELPLADIYDGNRFRDVDPEAAAAMAAGFEAGGQAGPVVVRPPESDEGIAQPFALVEGGHRIAAFRLLGRPTIVAEIREMTRLQAHRAELEENLFRSDLSPLDLGVFLKEHRRVWGELHPENTHGGDRKSRKSKDKIKFQTLELDRKGFTEEIARRCGRSKSSVYAALATVEALTPETIALLRGTDTARNASELKRLAAEPAERQVAVARLLREGKAASVDKARIAAGVAPTGADDPQEALFRHLVSNWARADRNTRRRFLEHAGLAEKVKRERMPTIAEVVGGGRDVRQTDIEDAIARVAAPRRRRLT